MIEEYAFRDRHHLSRVLPEHLRERIVRRALAEGSSRWAFTICAALRTIGTARWTTGFWRRRGDVLKPEPLAEALGRWDCGEAGSSRG